MSAGKQIQESPVKVKVCGITRLDQLHALSELGADFAGLIFYDKSPRCILNRLTGAEVAKENLNLSKVGVFVNSAADFIKQQVEDYQLDMVQLHGDEDWDRCNKISRFSKVIKVLRINEEDHICQKINNWSAADVTLMFDTDSSSYGGTGKKFNWSRLKDIDVPRRFFLSGGIGPEDVDAILEFIQLPVAETLLSIDINSRFEVSPGVKDLNKVNQFLSSLKQREL